MHKKLTLRFKKAKNRYKMDQNERLKHK